MSSAIFRGQLSPLADAVAVIMAGGSGTRFWPLSRTNYPKQFLPLTGSDASLIQATAERLHPMVGPKGILVVTAEHQANLVEQQLPQAGVLSEPSARNTAACVGYAAVAVLEKVGDLPMICLPADHMVWGEEHLREVFRAGVNIAKQSSALITIGIKPTAPETGYGYIKRGAVDHQREKLSGVDVALHRVARFVEKPDLETAKSYLRSGDFFWNSGMFIWRPSVILAAIREHLPVLGKGLEQLQQCISKGASVSELAAVYNGLESVSIDVGVMEKAADVVVLSGDSFQWSDVGSWSSWADLEHQYSGGSSDNFIDGDALLVDSERCVVFGSRDPNKRRLIAGVGLDDLIIVETPDAVLICHRERAQDVKKIVDALKSQKRVNLL